MKTSQSVHIAIDLGAASGRIICGVYDKRKLAIKEIHRFKNVPMNIDGLISWNINHIYKNVKIGIKKSAQIYGNQISTIGLDSWAVDYVLLDENDNCLFWPRHYRNERNLDSMKMVTGLLGKNYIYNQTGIQFMPINTLYQLYAEKLSASSLIPKAKTLLFIPDLLNFWLTGIKTAELTNASTSQFYNPVKNQWAFNIFQKLELPTYILPPISTPGSLLGNLTDPLSQELNLTNTKIALTASHDTASAIAAIPLSKNNNSVFISSGTWSLVGIQIDEPIINENSLKFGFTNEIGFAGNIRFLKNVTGMWLIQECLAYWQSIGLHYSIIKLVEAASKTRKSTSFIDPDHQSFQTHGNMPAKIKKYLKLTGQESPHSDPELIRIILKSIALKYKFVIEHLSLISKKPIENIQIVGGGANNKLLNQMCADVTGLEVKAGPIEATASGNILGQLISIDKLPSLEAGNELIESSFSTTNYYPKTLDQTEFNYTNFTDILSK